MTSNNSSFRKYTVVALLFAFMAINFADKAILGLVAVPLMEELNISSSEFGTIAGSFFFLFALSGVVVGFISNTVKSKPLLAILVVIWSISQIPIAFGASTIAVFIACRVLLGVGEGPAYPLALHACYKWFPDNKRNLPTAIIMQGGQVGMLLSGPLVGYLVVSFGWRSAFLVMAITGAVWLLLWLVLAKEGQLDQVTAAASKQTTPEPQQQAAPISSTTTPNDLSYKQLFLSRTFIGNLLLYWVAYWITSLVFTWLPSYLQKGLNYSTTETGWLFSLCIFFTIPIVSFTSYYSNRLISKGYSSRQARAYLAIGGTALGAVSLYLGFNIELPRIYQVILIAIGCGLPQVCFVLSAAISAEISPPSKRGASLAVTNSLATTAGLLAPMVMGHFVQNTANGQGFYYGFMLTAVILIAGALLGLILINPSKAKNIPHSATLPAVH